MNGRKTRYWTLVCCPEGHPEDKREFADVAPAELDEMAVKEAMMMRAEEFYGVVMRCLDIREARGNAEPPGCTKAS